MMDRLGRVEDNGIFLRLMRICLLPDSTHIPIGSQRKLERDLLPFCNLRFAIGRDQPK